MIILTWVEIKDSIGMALSSLKANKLRSSLTILGVMVGVSSVIALASIVNGLSGAVEEEIDNLGSNIIAVARLPFDVDREDLTDEQRNRPPITVDDAKAIFKNCPSVDGVSPENYYFKPGGNTIKYKNRKANRPRMMGAWPDYMKVNNGTMYRGRFISYTDNEFRVMVCVLGYDLAAVLFENENPIGKEIRANGNRFTVVGVFDKQETNFDNDERNRLLVMPYSTYEKIHPWEKALGLLVRAESYEKIDQAKEEIINALRIERKVAYNQENNFSLATQDNLKESVGEIINYIYLAMIIITSVGLMVGGIGVMNIMLVSVTERTREIGVRKAIGAKRSNIILQFLTEAMTLSGVGGIIGIVFGVIIGILANSGFGFPVTISIFWIIVGFVVSVSVGMFSGIYPAFKAACLDPIEALRYE